MTTMKDQKKIMVNTYTFNPLVHEDGVEVWGVVSVGPKTRKVDPTYMTELNKKSSFGHEWSQVSVHGRM